MDLYLLGSTYSKLTIQEPWGILQETIANLLSAKTGTNALCPNDIWGRQIRDRKYQVAVDSGQYRLGSADERPTYIVVARPRRVIEQRGFGSFHSSGRGRCSDATVASIVRDWNHTLPYKEQTAKENSRRMTRVMMRVDRMCTTCHY